MSFVNRLICRAMERPYYHLTRPDGSVYMFRYWLFGHGTERDRDDRLDHKPMLNPRVGWLSRWAARNLACVRVHHIVASDRDRDLHDHPGWNMSVVLRGGYWELIPCAQGSRYPFNELPDLDPRAPLECDELVGERCLALWRGPGAFVFRTPRTRHKLVLPAGGFAWSLFGIGSTTNRWGFYVGDRKVPWREYDALGGRHE